MLRLKPEYYRAKSKHREVVDSSLLVASCELRVASCESKVLLPARDHDFGAVPLAGVPSVRQAGPRVWGALYVETRDVLRLRRCVVTVREG